MLRTTCVFTGVPGSPGYATFYGAGSSSGEADLMGNFIGVFWLSLADFIQSAVTITISGDVQVVDPLTGLTTGQFTFEDNVVEGSGTGSAAPSLQGLIRWRTGDYTNGREIRGRTFVPWLAEGVSQAGRPSAGFLTDATAAAEQLLEDSAAYGGAIVYSQTHREIATIQTASVWSEFAVLRSRRD